MMSLFCFARFVILHPAATSSSSFLSLCSPVCHCCMAHRTLCTCAWAHVSGCWLNDSQFGCVYKAALFNKQPPWLTAARCMRNSDSKLHDVEITLVHSAACMYYLCVYVCLVTAIGSCKILLLLYIELTHSPSLLLSPFVPNKHLHLCVHACDPVCCGMSVFPMHNVSPAQQMHTHKHSHIHTYAKCVWCKVSAAFVFFVMVATECFCLVRCDWCVRTDRNMSSANSF